MSDTTAAVGPGCCPHCKAEIARLKSEVERLSEELREAETLRKRNLTDLHLQREANEGVARHIEAVCRALGVDRQPVLAIQQLRETVERLERENRRMSHERKRSHDRAVAKNRELEQKVERLRGSRFKASGAVSRSYHLETVNALAKQKPDWTRGCENCGQKPIVPATGLCGPCTFGEADTAGGNW